MNATNKIMDLEKHHDHGSVAKIRNRYLEKVSFKLHVSGVLAELDHTLTWRTSSSPRNCE